ncbi:coiled-coil domain-containing protein 22 [Olea europaea var. sylvestris]|uniref:coiled-coil domain-containing protein 22 n=1 Tax=Olea europaea var. sylvestris TaxID=158386 RepID=UPI000C1D0190|nr:coiled-coil domain-containing protein 22 [Olea europaea var. sylvestris]
MEESEEILLNSVANSGVPIPPGVSSVLDLTPSTLFSICSHAIRLIDRSHSLSFPTSLPEDSMADRVKICTELASAFKNLGFMGDLSFHKFLYPTEEDLYKVVRFLVGRLSESEAPIAVLVEEDKIGGVSKDNAGNKGGPLEKEEVLKGLKDVKLKTQRPESSRMMSEDDIIQRSDEFDLNLQNGTGVVVKETAAKDLDFSQGDTVKEELSAKLSELQHLEEEFELLKAAAEMIFDDQHAIQFYIEQLADQTETKRQKLAELESLWETIRKPLEEKKGNLEQSLQALNPEAHENLTKVKEIEFEAEVVLAEIKEREEELSKLSADLEKQPKLASRRSYIQRIEEITKNSRKQDIDIERILKDTRDLQLESNSIQDRLNRTYAVVDETIFREAKKDPVARQAYRLLTNIHESFEQIAEGILATDRTRRSVADYEAKLATTTSRRLNVDKLQADLVAIRKENDLLEQRLRDI